MVKQTHMPAKTIPASRSRLPTPPTIGNCGMPIWHGVHPCFTKSENHEFGTPRQPCCLAPRQPLASLLRIAAAPRQPCFAPRQPCLAPRQPLKTPRQPYFNLALKATSSSLSPLFIQMLACPFGRVHPCFTKTEKHKFSSKIVKNIDSH